MLRSTLEIFLSYKLLFVKEEVFGWPMATANRQDGREVMTLADAWTWLTQTPTRTLFVYAAITVAVFFVFMVAGSFYEDWQKKREKR
jgi:hypothetical protein